MNQERGWQEAIRQGWVELGERRFSVFGPLGEEPRTYPVILISGSLTIGPALPCQASPVFQAPALVPELS
jgi:hypothetical protein